MQPSNPFQAQIHNWFHLPNFIKVLYTLLQEAEHRNIIHWAPDGTHFILKDKIGFTDHVLPQYYKTNKFDSF